MTHEYSDDDPLPTPQDIVDGSQACIRQMEFYNALRNKFELAVFGQDKDFIIEMLLIGGYKESLRGTLIYTPFTPEHYCLILPDPIDKSQLDYLSGKRRNQDFFGMLDSDEDQYLTMINHDQPFSVENVIITEEEYFILDPIEVGGILILKRNCRDGSILKKISIPPSVDAQDYSRGNIERSVSEILTQLIKH